MKITDAFRLSYAQLTHYKRRSVATIMIVGLLFSVVLSVNFIVQGLENTFLQTANRLAGDTIYLQISQQPDTCETNFSNPSSPIFQCPDLGTELLEKSITTHHGQFLGATTNALFASTAQPYVKLDPLAAPAGTVPAIISYNQARHYNHISSSPVSYDQVMNLYSNALGQTIVSNDIPCCIVGISPEFRITTPEAFNPLEFILQPSLSGTLTPYTVPLSDSTSETSDSEPPLSYLAAFSSLDDAYAYISSESCNYLESSSCRNYDINELYTNRLALRQLFTLIHFILGFLSAIFIGIASLITLFTFLKITYQSTTDITFYRTVGASTLDICCIFLAYFLEICCCALLFALTLGLAIAFISSLANTSYLSDLLSASFGVPISGVFFLIGWNTSIILDSLAVFYVAPFALCFSLPRLLSVNTSRLKATT